MSDSIGARLRQARELRHLTIPQVSETTKLRTHYLQALENDDYSAIPSAAQARGFLRVYAQFLDLNLADLLPPPAASSPAPVEVAAPAAKPASTSAPAGLLASLRKRFSRPRKDQNTGDLPLSVPTGLVTEPPATSPAVDAPVPGSTEAETARRPKANPQEVRKNELSQLLGRCSSTYWSRHRWW